MKKSLVLGIMSGTSIDSVDYALCEVDGKTIRLCRLWSTPFPPAMQAELHAAARGELASYPLAQLHHDLGRFYARHARQGKVKVDVVGLHGQTIFHNPNPGAPATLQLGEPAYLVEALGAPVVSNFRAADMAAGGQGAPLATLFHQFVFAQPRRHVCVNNLGGISNVTSLNGGEILAFDTGPANVLIDMAMRLLTRGKMEMDKDGEWAARGLPSEPLLARWLKHRYFARKPPKSTGRELFGEPFFKKALRHMRKLSPYDKVATLTEFTARSIALNYRMHLPSMPDKILLTGGGAANPTLVRAITRQFSGGRTEEVTTSAALGWPVQAIEPAAFALLAWLRLNGKPGNLPKTTGARRAALLGQVSRY